LASVTNLRQGYSAAVAEVRRRVAAYAEAAWGSLDGSYRDADIQRLVGLIVPQVLAGQLHIANLTSVYIAAVAGDNAGHHIAAVPVDPGAVQNGRGVDPEVVYTRPGIEVYTALSNGKSITTAAAAGLTRLQSLVTTDLQMARVRQARTSYRSANVHFYRRVTRGPRACALCLIASTRRYRRGDLMPIHPGCQCGIEEITDKSAPLVLDQSLLDAVHAAVGKHAPDLENANAQGYQDLLIVHDHGEIGPVLGWRWQKFTGPGAIPAAPIRPAA
jgi:hypothetical protein